jgi:hypothetical protein
MHANRSMTRLFAVAVGLTLGATGPASAGSIPVVNAGFEDPSTTTFVNNIPGWDRLVATDTIGVQAYASLPVQLPDGGPEGLQFGFINVGGMFQDVPAVVTAGTTYTLTAFLGRRTDNPGASGILELDTTGGAVLATSGAVIPPLGGFMSASVVFGADAGSPYLGEGLRIVIRNPTPNVQLDIDLVTVSAVPEPQGLVLLATGLTIAAAHSRRRPRRG